MDKELEGSIIRALSPFYKRARTDVTAVYTDTGVKWDVDGGKLTMPMLRHHLNGGPARGVAYLMPGGTTTSLLTFDLDDHRKLMTWDDLRLAADKITEAASFYGIKLAAFRSRGGRGIHLHAMWQEPQDAHSVRVLGTQALALAGYKSGTRGLEHHEVEVFPKQDSVPVGGYGNQVFMPLAGKSVPLDELFMPLAKEDIREFDWPLSIDVPLVEKAPAEAGSQAANPARFDLIASALDAIDNDTEIGDEDDKLSYDEFRDLMFGVVNALGKGEQSYSLFKKFAKRNQIKWHGRDNQKPQDKGLAGFKKLWHSAKVKPGGKGAGSIFYKANQYGWHHPEAQGALDDDIVDEGSDGTEDPEDDGTVVLAPAVPPRPEPEDMALGFTFNKREDGYPNLQPNPVARRNDHLCNIANLAKIIECGKFLGHEFAYDTFRDQIVLRPMKGMWREFKDEDYTWIISRIETWPTPECVMPVVSKEKVVDALHAVARLRSFDSATVWINTLKWDGVDRVETFLHEFLGCEDTPYTRAVSRYLWTALAGRVLKPGVKADMVPVLVGKQGIRKSTVIAALAPDGQSFVKISLAKDDDSNVRLMKGRLVIEIDELRGMAGREAEAIRSFLSQTEDVLTPKFKEFQRTYSRRGVFIGSTNNYQFLVDPEGHRRFLPLEPGVEKPIDVDRIKACIEQLWAQGAAIFADSGVDWSAEKLAGEVHAKYEQGDEWLPIIQHWLETGETSSQGSLIEDSGAEVDPLGDGEEPEKSPEKIPKNYLGGVSAAEVMEQCFGIVVRNQKTQDTKRVIWCLKKLGYERKLCRNEAGKMRNAWVLPQKQANVMAL